MTKNHLFELTTILFVCGVVLTPINLYKINHQVVVTTKPQNRVNEEFIGNISAYTSSVEETDSTPNITASGEVTREGGIACPKRYPFKTIVEISGKRYTCNDRMTRKYTNGNYFDIWFKTKREAIVFGRQKLIVKVIHR